MYYIVYHTPDGDTELDNIARVDFAPAVDMTLNSLPVDTFTADIRTRLTIERGNLARLMSSHGQLFAEYYINKVQRIDRDTVRVEAVSQLWLFDWWTVGAERINTTAANAINDLFYGLPKSGYKPIAPPSYILPNALGAVQINGFAPEQTARERLLWLCVAMGAWMQQSFCQGFVFHALPDLANLSAGKLIPIRDTYWKPDTQLGDPVYEVDYEFTQDMSTTEDYEDMQSGTDESGTTYYWLTGHWVRTNPAVDMPGGSEVKYAGITLLSNNSDAADIIDKLTRILMNRLEITAEVIDNGDIQPGDVVRVYTDEHLIYHGIVKQCTFTFGQQAKARLTISASPDALPIQIVRVLYTADGVPLGQHTEVFPEGDVWEIENPEIDGYTPDSPSITGSTGGTYTEDYTKIPLVWIEAHNNSFTQYLEGKNISYARLLVLGYQTQKTAATQVKWTNGGQWLDGKIPFEALTLPVTKAVYDPTTPSQEYPGASIQAIPVQYIDENGTTFEDSFNVIVYENKPVTLQIVSLPDKLDYLDGEDIQYNGLVVRALLPNGMPWEDDEHPGGIIPIAELTLTETEADIEKTSEEKRKVCSDFGQGEWPQPISCVTGELRNTYNPYSLIQYDGYIAVLVRDDDNYVWQRLCCTDIPGTRVYFDPGTGTHPEYIDVDATYTHNGKTVYYTGGWTGLTHAIIPGVNRRFPGVIDGGLSTAKAAWTLVYGESVYDEGQQVIPISWRYSDDVVLTTSFEITVQGDTV